MRFSILICLLLLQSPLALSHDLKAIHLVYEEKPNPPYHLGSSTFNGDKPGITLEVLDSIQRKLDVKFIFHHMPWSRALKEVATNRIDGIFHASFKQERLKYGVYPMKDGMPDVDRRIMRQSYVLYKLKNSKLKWDGERFHNLDGPIGATLGYAIVDDLKTLGVNVWESRTQVGNLRMLSKGYLIGVAGLETMNDAYLKNQNLEFRDVIKVLPPIRQKAYYLLFSRQFASENRVLANSIWDMFKEIRRSGEYDRIASKYL